MKKSWEYPRDCDEKIRGIKTAEDFRILYITVASRSAEFDWKIEHDLDTFAYLNGILLNSLRFPKDVADFIWPHLDREALILLPRCKSDGRPGDGYDQRCRGCFRMRYLGLGSHSSRKVHSCCRCDGPILPGDIYWSSGPMYGKHCWRCVSADVTSLFGAQS